MQNFTPYQPGPIGPKVHSDPIAYTSGIVAKAGTIFAPATAVRTANAMYMCIADHVTGPVIDLAKWQIIVNDGVQGATGPAAWAFPVAYASGIDAVAVAPSTTVIYGGETYVCNTAHTTGAIFDAAKWTKVAQKGANGADGASSGGITLPVYATGRYYNPYDLSNPAGGAAIAADIIVLLPFRFHGPVNFDSLATRVRTAAASGNIALAWYASVAAAGSLKGYPTGTPIATSGSLSTATAGLITGAFSSVSAAAGIYWMAAWTNTAGATALFDIQTGNPYLSIFGSTNGAGIASSGPPTGLKRSSTLAFGSAWPDLTGMSIGSGFTENTGNGYALTYFRAP